MFKTVSKIAPRRRGRYTNNIKEWHNISILRVHSDIHCECSKSIAYVTCTIDIEYSQCE